MHIGSLQRLAVSKNEEPEYIPQISKALMIRTPAKRTQNS